jgi:outer membrane lipoprotein-sorting protein
MKHLLRQTLIIASLLAFSGSLWAQTAEEIVEKHLAALGGRENLSKLTSRSVLGSMTITTPGGEINGSIEISAKAPNKTRTYMKLDLSSPGASDLVVDQRFDGKTGYVLNSIEGNREITGNQLENMRNARFPTSMLSLKEDGVKLELGGKEKMGDREAYLLITTPKSGSASKHFIDAETFFLLRLVMKVDVPQLGGPVEQTIDFSDFKEVDGVKIPFRQKLSGPAQTFSVTLSKVEHNIPLDEAIFVKPSAEKQEVK